MTCTRCKGAGWIAGHWMPETCPECDGKREFHVEPVQASGWFALAGWIALMVATAAVWLLAIVSWAAA